MTLEEAKGYLLRRAKELGLDAEVLFQEERELSLRARQGALEEIKEARQGGIGLRVEAQGRLATPTRKNSPRRPWSGPWRRPGTTPFLPGKKAAFPRATPWEATTFWEKAFPPPWRPKSKAPWSWKGS